MAVEPREGRTPVPRPVGGEQRLIAALAVRYRGALNRFFRRRAPQFSSDTEDLTQEVFLRLAARAEGAEIERIDGYIFQTASSVLTDRVRRMASRSADLHSCYDEDCHAVEDFSPERVLLGKEQLALVRTVLENLPERVRVAFVLHRFEELSYAETAQRLGVSVSSVEKYISHALRELTAARHRCDL